MKNLKDKLYEKAETIKENSAKLAVSNDMGYGQGSNIIQLNQSEVQRTPSIVPDFAISLEEAKMRIAMLQEFVKNMMIPNIDYGIIPGCKKPSLYKAGAEKLCDIFAFSKQIDVINRVEDWEKGVFHYEIKATLISKKTGYVEAEGIGCCNNKEKKYKDMPSYNTINTVLKMAKKRALIDAVLSATRSSGLFTQDIEDFEPYSKNEASQNQKDDNSRVSDTSKSVEAGANAPTSFTAASKKQLSLILSLVEKNKIPYDDMKKILMVKYKISESKELNKQQADDLIKYLNSCLTN